MLAVSLKQCCISFYIIVSPQAMDRNKDGFITKGELKLAKKSIGMAEIDGVIKQYDIDKDGKLNMDEFQKSGAH